MKQYFLLVSFHDMHGKHQNNLMRAVSAQDFQMFVLDRIGTIIHDEIHYNISPGSSKTFADLKTTGMSNSKFSGVMVDAFEVRTNGKTTFTF